MTLFRKVFQNQSSLAEQGDAPVEDELRSALNAVPEEGPAEVSDPFDLAEYADPKDKASEATAEQPEDRSPAQETEEFATPDTGTSGDDLVDGILSAVESDGAVKDDLSAAKELSNNEHICPEDGLAIPPAPDDVEKSGVQTNPDADEPAAEAEHEVRGTSGAPEEVGQDTEADVTEDLAKEANKSASFVSEPQDVPAIDLSVFAREQLGVPENTTLHNGSTKPGTAAPADGGGAVPTLAAGRSGRRAGRVKTRLLGFNRDGATEADPFQAGAEVTAGQEQARFPVGWLVVVAGPGMGHSFSVFAGASVIGRGEDQVIRLDFGDNSISRQNHAAIAYDDEQNKFYIGHGGKSNIIRRNARPVLSTEELNHADLIRIGETTLRFVALCGSDFKWDDAGNGHDTTL